MKKVILFGILFLASLSRAISTSDLDSFIVLEATINNQSVYFAVDTGAETTVLFSPAAQRLGLKTTPIPTEGEIPSGKVRVELSETLTFSIPGVTNAIDVRFPVFELPPEAAFTRLGGLIGWNQIKDNILQIDAGQRQMKGVDTLPIDIGMWSKWDIYPYKEFDVLLIKAIETAGQAGVILIDTGSKKGVSLNAQLWQDFSDKQKGGPQTVMAFYTPAVGLKVYREYWAEQLAIGRFTISQVPVANVSEVFEQAIPGLIGDMGLFGLSRFDVIIDGRSGYVYMRPKDNRVSNYQYNRIAAVFIPADLQSVPLVAHVVENGPAYQAGIRDGDILLKIDDLDVTQWRTDPNVLPLSRFFEQSAGSRLVLSLTREDKTFTAAVELEEIFPLGRDETLDPENENRLAETE